MGSRARPLAVGSIVAAVAGCSAITSFDDFVGDGLGGTSGGTSGGSSGGTSGGSSGGTSGGSSGGTSGGTSSGQPNDDGGVDAGKDGPCVVRTTGFKRGSAVLGANGGVGWTQVNSALAADGAGASVTLSPSQDDSALLVVSGFGFAIPTSATLEGIRVSIVRRASRADLRDEDVLLMSDSSQIGMNKGRGDDLPLSFAPMIYGSATDPWGIRQVITIATINAPTFGVAFRAGYHGELGSGAAEVDEIQVDIAYCE